MVVDCKPNEEAQGHSVDYGEIHDGKIFTCTIFVQNKELLRTNFKV